MAISTLDTLDKLRSFTTESDQYSASSIDMWQECFARLFKERNAARKEPQFIWLKVFEKATALAEAIRKHNFDEATQAVARIFCWLSAFCSNNEKILGTHSLGEVVWWKYRGVCPHCARELKQLLERIPPAEVKRELKTVEKCRRCRCDAEEVGSTADKDIDEEVLKYFGNIIEQPKTLDGWVEMFNLIYTQNITLLSLEACSFHLFEEVGEVGMVLRCYAELCTVRDNTRGYDHDDILRAMNDKDKKPRYVSIKDKNLPKETFLTECLEYLVKCIKEEIADVFSWLSAVVIKLGKIRAGYVDYEKRSLQFSSPDVRNQTATGKLLSKLLDEFVPNSRKLSSMIALTYTNGCTKCNNLMAAPPSIKCICKNRISRRVYG